MSDIDRLRKQLGMPNLVETKQSDIDRIARALVVASEFASPEAALDYARAALLEYGATPVPMLMFCPGCGTQHIDAPEPETGWTNPPHATHTCKACRLNWRPSNHNTVGVESIECLEVKHALRIEASRLAKNLPRLAGTVKRLEEGLQWYADGNHFELPGWEVEEGWMCPTTVENEPWVVECGNLAQAILNGGRINPDPDADESVIFDDEVVFLVPVKP